MVFCVVNCNANNDTGGTCRKYNNTNPSKITLLLHFCLLQVDAIKACTSFKKQQSEVKIQNNNFIQKVKKEDQKCVNKFC